VRAGPARAAYLLLPLALSAATAVGSTAAAAGTAPPEGYYTMHDFRRVEKIDAHMHVHGPADRLMAQAIADHFRILTINVDSPDYPPIRDQQLGAVSLRKRYPGRVAFAATFSVGGFQRPGWSAGVLQDIDAAVAQGAVGVKIWKNIGMQLRDVDGSYVMPDDMRLEPIIAHLEREHLVLLGHQAEPRNCWLPADRMTVRSDREYFEAHPQYYMHLHPEVPSQEVILAARNEMLRTHPSLRFDAVHLASLEWDVDRVADFLERFPNASVDMAARLVHLEYQAASQPEKVRRFLISYQDRVLYGSDDAYGPDDSDSRPVEEVHTDWLNDWRFLVTSDRMHSADFDAGFSGLHLPRAVVDKIYRRNAEALFPSAWSMTPTRQAIR
jgi:predicted TIM-barrel fold metal-dependent hydrolase